MEGGMEIISGFLHPQQLHQVLPSFTIYCLGVPRKLFSQLFLQHRTLIWTLLAYLESPTVNHGPSRRNEDDLLEFLVLSWTSDPLTRISCLRHFAQYLPTETASSREISRTKARSGNEYVWSLF